MAQKSSGMAQSASPAVLSTAVPMRQYMIVMSSKKKLQWSGT